MRPHWGRDFARFSVFAILFAILLALASLSHPSIFSRARSIVLDGKISSFGRRIAKHMKDRATRHVALASTRALALNRSETYFRLENAYLQLE